MILFVDGAVCVVGTFFYAAGFVEPTFSTASGCLLGWFFYQKPHHFTHPKHSCKISSDRLPPIIGKFQIIGCPLVALSYLM